MNNFVVTRAHLKNACDQKNWDLLDRLLEINRDHIDDASFYTDTWGEWWGLLLECVTKNHKDGVRVLLKHGANKEIGNWGDCIPISPIEAAADKPAILKLLTSVETPTYYRTTDPPLPNNLSAEDQAINQQGKVRDETGLVIPIENFDQNDESN